LLRRKRSSFLRWTCQSNIKWTRKF
jgi:hypothetical protein